MLERWSGMSACYSKPVPPGMVPRWAALFKAENGSRIHLHTPDGVQVQFAPHGSYRLPNVVDYLQWALDDPAAERETYTIVPVLDWYSAHLAEEVQEIVKLKTGSPVVYLGGGTTDVQAVCDVTAHHELSQIYKIMQAEDQMRDLLREILSE